MPRVKAHYLILFLLWAGVTAIDLDKAFHIDDTFHLKAAQWIAQHPSEPMSGTVNWGDGPQPISDFNQPPGFFYLVALTGSLFGWSEIPMHVLRSLFSLLAILCFYRLARHRTPEHALVLTALLALGPAFMVDQGVMTDVPLLSMQLLFFSLLLVPGTMRPGFRYAFAGLALSGAMFIKYTTVPLLVLFPLALLLLGARRHLWTACIPLVLIACWSYWNLHDYGAIHLMDREGGDPSLRGIFVRTLALLLCAGAMAPFTPLFIGSIFQRGGTWLRTAMMAPFTLGLLFTLLVLAGAIPERSSDTALRVVFLLNGLLLAGMAVRYLPLQPGAATAENQVLFGWAAFLALFVAGFAPTMATRHLLLMLPPVLLLIAPAVRHARQLQKAVAIGCTALLGVLLTISDKHYADFYRNAAPRIAQELHDQGRIWSLGHWGWQWYSERAGMEIYAGRQSDLAVGDILVIPADIAIQSLPPTVRLRSFASWDGPPGPATIFCVEQFASMYTSTYGKLPWDLGRSHHTTIIAYRVMSVR